MTVQTLKVKEYQSYLNTEFGLKLAMQKLELSSSAIEQIVGRYSKGKRQGELRGKLVWYKIEEGGWCYSFNCVVRDRGMSYGYHIENYDGTILYNDCTMSNVANALAYLNPILQDRKSKYYRELNSKSEVEVVKLSDFVRVKVSYCMPGVDKVEVIIEKPQDLSTFNQDWVKKLRETGSYVYQQQTPLGDYKIFMIEID